jgi:hypothetical protein
MFVLNERERMGSSESKEPSDTTAVYSSQSSCTTLVVGSTLSTDFVSNLSVSSIHFVQPQITISDPMEVNLYGRNVSEILKVIDDMSSYLVRELLDRHFASTDVKNVIISYLKP